MAALSSCNSTELGRGTTDEDQALETLVAAMSTEQKVGQMTQLNFGFLSTSRDQHDGKPGVPSQPGTGLGDRAELEGFHIGVQFAIRSHPY